MTASPAQGRECRDAIRHAAVAWKDIFGGMLGSAFVKFVEDTHGNIVVVRDASALAKELRPHVHDGMSSILLDASLTHGKTHGDLVEDLAFLTCVLVAAGMDLVDRGISPTMVAKGFEIATSIMRASIANLPHVTPLVDEGAVAARLRERMTVGLDPVVANHLAGLLAAPLVRCHGYLAPARGGPFQSTTVAATGAFFKTFSMELVPGGRILDSFLVPGVALRHEPLAWRSRSRGALAGALGNARVAIVDGNVYFEPRKHDHLEFVLDTPDAVAGMAAFWEARWRAAAKRLLELNVDIVATERGIDDAFVSAFQACKPGAVIFRRVPRDRLDRLASASGATIVPSIDLLGSLDTGHVARTRVVSSRGDDVFLFDCGEGSGHATLVIRGGTHDVCEGVRDVVTGAISAEIASWPGIVRGYPPVLATAISGATATSCQRANGTALLAVVACLDAINDLARAHAVNAGLDPFDGISRLRGKDVSLASMQACVGTAISTAARLVRVDGFVQLQKKESKSPDVTVPGRE